MTDRDPNWPGAIVVAVPLESGCDGCVRAGFDTGCWLRLGATSFFVVLYAVAALVPVSIKRRLTSPARS